MYSRIRFTRSLLSSLLSLWKGDVAEGQRHLAAAQENIKVVADTVDMGEKPEEGKDMMGEKENIIFILHAFSRTKKCECFFKNKKF